MLMLALVFFDDILGKQKIIILKKYGKGDAVLEIKKMHFAEQEIERLIDELDGYMWVVLDIKKGIIVVGDEFVGVLKYELLKMKCAASDIFGVGIDLRTGEIDFYSPVNVKFFDKTSTRAVPEEKRERVETLIKYFFSELPAYKKEKTQPRFTKKYK